MAPTIYKLEGNGERRWQIDTTLLTTKLHYFLLFFGYSGVSPYLPMLGKALGLPATAVGLCYTCVLLLGLVVVPFYGYLSDYFRAIKCICISILTVAVGANLSLIFVPPIHLSTFGDSEILRYPSFPNTSYFSNELNSTFGKETFRNFLSENTMEIVTEKIAEPHFNVTLYQNDTSIIHSTPPTNRSMFDWETKQKNSSKIFNQTSLDNFTNSSVYSTFQFWIFFVCVIVSLTNAESAVVLSDAMCREALGNRMILYGRQRLFGTIGWAIGCFIAGFLNGLSTGNSERQDYSSGIYLAAAFIFFDAFVICQLPTTSNSYSKNSFKDFRKVFRSGQVVVFAMGSVFIGILSSILANYEFWYLQDLGAPQILQGSTIAVQCLLAEVPFLFASGWFIKKFGCFHCVTFSFMAFGLRFFLYSIIQNPWWAMGINLLHGVNFALYHVAMTSFAALNAPEGLEATMFGTFNGLSKGLGPAIGSLLGGVAVDKLGGRYMFTVASGLGFTCALIFFISSRTILRHTKKRRDFEMN